MVKYNNIPNRKLKLKKFKYSASALKQEKKVCEKLAGKKAPKEVTLRTTFRTDRAVFKATPKQRAPRAIREIKKSVRRMFKVREVNVNTELNKLVWSKGIRYPPKKIRLEITRRPLADEDGKQKYACDISIPLEYPTSFSRLNNQRVNPDEVNEA